MRIAHIIAVAARTAVGVTAEGSAAAVRARISRIMEHPFMVDASGGKVRGARDRTIAIELSGVDRLSALSEGALSELAAKLTSFGASIRTLPVFLSVAEPRPGHSRQESESLVRAHAALAYQGIERIAVQIAGEGHAGALLAFERAVNAVTAGEADICVAGGVDSYFQADTLDWLEQNRRVARSGSPGGFPPGEAAGYVAVASDDVRRRMALPSLARVRGIASTHEKRQIDSEEGLLGEALGDVLFAAARGVAGGDFVEAIFCDINGERWRTDDWGFAMLRASQLFRDPTTYVTGVSEWGDVGAASGALSCILAVQAWRRSYAEGRRAMICGSSWGGLRSAVVLEHGAG